MGIFRGQIRELPKGLYNTVLEPSGRKIPGYPISEGSRRCPKPGQKWGQIWGLEKDPFWTISTYKDFVNTRATLLESMILGVSNSMFQRWSRTEHPGTQR